MYNQQNIDSTTIFYHKYLMAIILKEKYYLEIYVRYSNINAQYSDCHGKNILVLT